MTRLSELMREYFEKGGELSSASRVESVISSTGLLVESMPIEPSKIEWEIQQEPERFVRKYEFDDRRRLISFVDEILEAEDEMNHHSDIQISHKTVTISVYTKNIERITELDIEFTQTVDKIHRDVLDYNYNRERSEI